MSDKPESSIVRPRPVPTWPPKEQLTPLPPCERNGRPEYPAIMTQWVWGICSYWSDESEAFILQANMSGDFNIGNMDGPLIEVRLDNLKPKLNRKELGWGWLYAKSCRNNRSEMHRLIMANEAPTDMEFWLCDLAMENSEAAARSYAVINTHVEPGCHVKIPQVYQVVDDDGYNEVFDRWKVSGFVGAICQEYSKEFDEDRLLSDVYL